MKETKIKQNDIDCKSRLRKQLANSLQTSSCRQIFKDKDNCELLVDLILNSAVRIIPQNESTYRKITLTSFSLGGKTVKLRNIRLNIRDFFEAIGSATITTTGVFTFPWIAPLGLLMLINQILKNATIEIGESEGKIMWTMWEIYNEGKNELTFNNILRVINRASKEKNIPSLTNGEIKEAILKLESLQCIKQVDINKWEIIERVEAIE